MEETPKIMEKDSRLRVKMRCLSLKFRSWIDPVRCVACGLRATKWFSKHTLGRQWETYFVNFKAQLSPAMWLWGTYLSFLETQCEAGPNDITSCQPRRPHALSTRFMSVLFWPCGQYRTFHATVILTVYPSQWHKIPDECYKYLIYSELFRLLTIVKNYKIIQSLNMFSYSKFEYNFDWYVELCHIKMGPCSYKNSQLLIFSRFNLSQFLCISVKLSP